jgi:hypothetical protein
MDERAGTPIKFRLSETPCFFPKALLDQMGRDGEVLIRQLVDSPKYHKLSEISIPAEYRAPNESQHPMFIQVDFGLVRNEQGDLKHKLVELQAFPSLYAYQAAMAQTYVDVHGLGDLRYLLSGLDRNSYQDLLRRALRHASVKDAVSDVAAATGRPRREIYQRALALSEDGGTTE